MTRYWIPTFLVLGMLLIPWAHANHQHGGIDHCAVHEECITPPMEHAALNKGFMKAEAWLALGPLFGLVAIGLVRWRRQVVRARSALKEQAPHAPD